MDATARAGAHACLGFSHNVLFLYPDPGEVFRRAFAAAAGSMVEGRGIEDTARALREGIDRILDYFTSKEGWNDSNAGWGVLMHSGCGGT